jgi:DNA-directed RNA polymerase subunit P
MYKCFGCGHKLTKEEVDRRIICPYCGSRVIVKTRPKTLKQVKAR